MSGLFVARFLTKTAECAIIGELGLILFRPYDFVPLDGGEEMEQRMIFKSIISLDSYNPDRKTFNADPSIRQNGFKKPVSGKDLEEEGAFLNSFVMEGINRRDISVAYVLTENEEGEIEEFALAQELPIEPSLATRFVLFNAEVCSPEEAELTIVVENGKYLYREYVRFALGHIV